MPTDAPHWERGYRCHGYWRGQTRVGHVAIGPRGYFDGIYLWSVDVGPGPLPEGTARSLRTAKNRVEQHYAALAAA